MKITTTSVHMRDVRKTYRAQPALRGVDLALRAGEVLALLGPNGAGKTTTLEILAGFRRPDSGEVTVLGERPWNAGRRWRERVGMVTQEQLGNSAGPDLTVGEALRATTACYPDPWDETSLLRAVGLHDRRAARVHRLSGGQRRRLDIGLGIAGRPQLLLLDEPTTGLDPQARQDVWELVCSLAAGGTTILLTTHYLDEAEHLADRVAVLLAGRVAVLDTPGGLRARHAADPVVRWTEAGVVQELRTDRPTEAVERLHRRFGGEIPDLTVERPSLEQAYLALVAGASEARPGLDPATIGGQ